MLILAASVPAAAIAQGAKPALYTDAQANAGAAVYAQSCAACQTNLRDAQAFDQMADRMLQAARTAPAAHHGHAEPPDPLSQPGLSADREAGQ